jgi:hypothetical protein
MSKFELNPDSGKYCLVKKNSDNTLDIKELGKTKEPFVKSIYVYAIVRRDIVTLNLDKPRSAIFYKVKFFYEVKSDNPDIFLTLIERAWMQESVFSSKQRIYGLYLRDFSGLQITKETPILNENYGDEYRDILNITRMESEQISKDEILKLIGKKDNHVIGFFNEDLTKRI